MAESFAALSIVICKSGYGQKENVSDIAVVVFGSYLAVRMGKAWILLYLAYAVNQERGIMRPEALKLLQLCAQAGPDCPSICIALMSRRGDDIVVLDMSDLLGVMGSRRLIFLVFQGLVRSGML